eukprot:scaffold788_cov231-Pinguiococcus_pyrenoidosus.AAC.8
MALSGARTAPETLLNEQRTSADEGVVPIVHGQVRTSRLSTPSHSAAVPWRGTSQKSRPHTTKVAPRRASPCPTTRFGPPRSPPRPAGARRAPGLRSALPEGSRAAGRASGGSAAASLAAGERRNRGFVRPERESADWVLWSRCTAHSEIQMRRYL